MVYPRVCGGNRCAAWGQAESSGLSPRVRGKPRQRRLQRQLRGSIPACAGETSSPALWSCLPGVYPRVCGGNANKVKHQHYGEGLSPRVRGKRGRGNQGRRRSGSIPACAGEAFRRPFVREVCRVYPRVCGGSPCWSTSTARQWGLSPRVRGKPERNAPEIQDYRSIPACAGEAP